MAPTSVRKLGVFTPAPGPAGKEALVDAGAFYASKDFYDPVKQRRINFGWAQISCVTIITAVTAVRAASHQTATQRVACMTFVVLAGQPALTSN